MSFRIVLVELTSPDHDKHQQNEQGRKNFRIDQVLLPFQFETQQQLEEEDQQQLYEAPGGPQCSGLVQPFEVLPDENDHAEVRVQAVTQE